MSRIPKTEAVTDRSIACGATGCDSPPASGQVGINHAGGMTKSGAIDCDRCRIQAIVSSPSRNGIFRPGPAFSLFAILDVALLRLRLQDRCGLYHFRHA